MFYQHFWELALLASNVIATPLDVAVAAAAD